MGLLLSIFPEWGVLTFCLRLPGGIAKPNCVVRKLHQCYGSLLAVILIKETNDAKCGHVSPSYWLTVIWEAGP